MPDRAANAPAALPARVEARLDLGGVEGLVQHRRISRGPARSPTGGRRCRCVRVRRGRRRARSRRAPAARPCRGRLVSSHCFSSGRISSRTMSSMVGPPRVDLGRALGGQRAQQRADRGRCAAAASGAIRCRRWARARAGDCRAAGRCRRRRRGWRRGAGSCRWRQASGAAAAASRRVRQHHRRVELQHAIVVPAARPARPARRRRAPPPRSGSGGSRPGCPPSTDRRRPPGRRPARRRMLARSDLLMRFVAYTPCQRPGWSVA